MLPASKELFCFLCHGNLSLAMKIQTKGMLANSITTIDIQREFQKTFRHPLEITSIHRLNEIMPERDPSIPRHVACGDCHHHHLVNSENRIANVKGVNREGLPIDRISYEYELCYKCHSFSANLPADQTNKAELFNLSNPSFHPIEAPGKNNDVPSLIPSLSTSNTITCTDCHNNDDSVGPKGPHGSSYNHLLTKYFSDKDGPEGLDQYELCYICHKRSSILNNESFPFHNLHVVQEQTSCRTCHNPHGSIRYTHLIDFDNSPAFIRPSESGRLEFFDLGNQSGECHLNCHDKEHNPAVYPSAGSSVGSSVGSSGNSSAQDVYTPYQRQRDPTRRFLRR